jgi:multiple sugar transport system substrate-binding protein/putative aldouronate transport system substrate-binding protein
MEKVKAIRKIVSMILSIMLVLTMVVGITGCTKGEEPADGQNVSAGDGSKTDQSGPAGDQDPSGGGTSSGGAGGDAADGLPAAGDTSDEAGTGTAEDQPISQEQAGSGEIEVVESTEAAEKPQELITLDVYSQLANWSGKQIGWYAALLEDKFNVRLNIIPDTEGTYETLVESGDLGDIVVWGDNGAEYKKAVQLGLLYDWEEGDLCKTYAPMIWKNCQIALETNRKISGDGHIYGIGHGVAMSKDDHQSFFYTWDIRWDLYKQLGYPKVKNLDDYLELLKKMKEICPKDENGRETYAVSLWPDWDGDMVMYVKSMATAYYGYDEHHVGLYNPKNGEYYDALMENGPYLEMLRFFNKLYQNNLLDPNSMTQTWDQMSEKVKAGGTFFSIFNFAGSAAYNTTEHMNQGKMMLPLVPEDAAPAVYGMSMLGGNRIWSIGAYTEYPELCMEILNYLFTPEGAMTIWYGLPGLMWYYDDNGYTHFTDLGLKCNRDPHYDLSGVKWTSPWTGKTYTLGANYTDGSLQINNTTWVIDTKNPDSNGETFNKDSWRSMAGPAQSSIEKDWRDYFKVTTVNEYMKKGKYTVVPGTSYSAPKRSDELELIWTQVTQAIKQYSWRAIYAKNDGEFNYHVQQMIKVCNEYGYDQVREWSRQQAAVRYRLQQAEN